MVALAKQTSFILHWLLEYMDERKYCVLKSLSIVIQSQTYASFGVKDGCFYKILIVSVYNLDFRRV